MGFLVFTKLSYKSDFTKEFLHLKPCTPNSAAVIFHTSYISLSQTVEHIQNERDYYLEFGLVSSHYHNRDGRKNDASRKLWWDESYTLVSGLLNTLMQQLNSTY